jgi:ribosomal protein S18 acetylase RimI-like enzyme
MAERPAILPRDAAVVPDALLLEADPSPEAVAAYRERALAWTAEAEGAVLAAVLVLPPQAGGPSAEGHAPAEIVNLAVAPGHRRRGLARALLRAVLDEAVRRGWTRLRVATADSSAPALALYAGLGFRETRRDPDHFPRHYPRPIVEHGRTARDRVILERPVP